jgi:hypothetical protein
MADELVEAEFTRMTADLTGRGYREIAEYEGIKAGARVHHVGERFVEAYRDGTAVVLAVFEKDPSSWAVKYRERDIEILARRDKPHTDSRPVSQWANYHTRLTQEDGRG